MRTRVENNNNKKGIHNYSQVWVWIKFQGQNFFLRGHNVNSKIIWKKEINKIEIEIEIEIHEEWNKSKKNEMNDDYNMFKWVWIKDEENKDTLI